MPEPLVHFVSLGCDKNRVDSESAMGLLCEMGYAPTEDPAKALVIVVNTCGFIRDAVQESIDTLLRLAEYKQSGLCKALVVTGCMAQRYRGEVSKELPEVDAVLGVDEYTRLPDVVRGLTEAGYAGAVEAADADGNAVNENTADTLCGAVVPSGSEALYARRFNLPIAHVAYVKISEGCNNRCTYCTIPSIRGPYLSRPFEAIVEECRLLVIKGARELVLVAQDTALYGVDLYGYSRLHELLAAVNAIDALTWVRVMYVYPEHITPALIKAIADCPKVCQYLDMPIQHSHDRILKRMGRRSTNRRLREVISALRTSVPGIVLRTTLMVGFPGETEAAFEDLRAFVNEMRFDRLGVFAYSREEGTPAALMKQQVKPAVKQSRRDILMRDQQIIHKEKQDALIGQTLTVMVDGKTETGGEWTGRSYRDAFETDASVYFKSAKLLKPGQAIPVTVRDADEYDLYGVACDESAQ